MRRSIEILQADVRKVGMSRFLRFGARASAGGGHSASRSGRLLGHRPREIAATPQQSAVAKEKKIPFFAIGAGGASLTGKDCNTYMIHYGYGTPSICEA
jgi:hypothetical protein